MSSAFGFHFNNRQWKILGRATPAEVFQELCSK
jgi:hypothetical protein